MKKVVILDYGGKRQLANQLWNFASIYAYCLENNYFCENYSFFNYSQYFNFPVNNIFVKLFFLNSKINQTHLFNRLKPYSWFVNFVRKYIQDQVITSDLENYFFLSPSSPNNITAYASAYRKLKNLENKPDPTIYFDGWMFRNPEGLEKFRKEIRQAFKPREEILSRVENRMAKLRSRYKKIIGLHIRQKDYKNPKFYGGKLYFSQEEVRDLLDKYVLYLKENEKRTCFLICSDEVVNLDIFRGLNVEKGFGPKGMIEDLFSLANTDLILGSNSTYGRFAAYYGNIPFIQFQRSKMDWSKVEKPYGCHS